MGKLIKQLGDNAQIFCITHLPQVACMADTHFKLQKTEKNKETTTERLSLDATARIQELARLLGGTKITPQALDNAKTLLETVD